MALLNMFVTRSCSSVELNSNFDMVRARASHSRLLKAKTITGLKFLSMIILMILEMSEGPG